MNYEDWLKSLRRNARHRYALEQKLSNQATRFSNFIIADLDTRMGKGASADQLIDEYLGGFDIPQQDLIRYRNQIESTLQEYSDFRQSLDIDDKKLFDGDFERMKATVNFEGTPEQQAKKDVVKALRKATGAGLGRQGIIDTLKQSGLKDHLDVEAGLALQEFSNNYSFAVSDQSQTKLFEYFGPSNDAIIRPFCDAIVGYRFTDAQISTMINGTGFEVKRHCGGPRCRHDWVNVPEALATGNPEKIVDTFEYQELGEGKRPLRVFLTEDNKERVRKHFEE